MKGRKPSFLEHLTGSRPFVPDELEEEEYQDHKGAQPEKELTEHEEELLLSEDAHDEEEKEPEKENEEEEEDDDNENEIPGMAVDLYEVDNEIVVQCMIAGVMPENLHISITRKTITIEGKRNEPEGIPDDNYAIRELYWGPFRREIELPHEVDPDKADAVERYGLLIIRLSKFDTKRIQELKVKSV